MLFTTQNFSGTGAVFIMQITNILKLGSILGIAHKTLDTVLPDCIITPLPLSTYGYDKPQVIFGVSGNGSMSSTIAIQEKIKELHSILMKNGQVVEGSPITSIAVKGDINTFQE